MPHEVLQTMIFAESSARSHGGGGRSEGGDHPLVAEDMCLRSAPTIAVVDDDEDVRIALTELIESLGYRVAPFDTGDVFLAEAAIEEIDCIVSDVHMPGTNGLKLARLCRAWNKPVILITAFPSAELERQATDAGVDCFLRKPFDPLRLIDKLSELVG